MKVRIAGILTYELNRQRRSMNTNAIGRRLGPIILVPLLCWLISCHPNDDSELTGVYSAEHNWTKATLTLYPDHRFVQVVALIEHDFADSASGLWSYDAETHYVTFDSNFVGLMSVPNVVHDLQSRQAFGLHALPADNYFGSVTIGSSEGVVYKKRSAL